MTVRHIRPVTLAVRDMATAVDFYQAKVGLELLYGGEGASFTSFRVDIGYLNLVMVPQGDAGFAGEPRLRWADGAKGVVQHHSYWAITRWPKSR